MIILPYVHKGFSSTITASVGVNQVTGNEEVVLSAKPFYYVSSNNQWKLKNRIAFMVNTWYASSKYEGVFKHKAQYAVDLSASKKWKDHWTVTLNAFDIFRSLNYRETFQFNDMYSNILYYENVREFGLNIKYVIGTNANSKYKMMEINDSGNRIN